MWYVQTFLEVALDSNGLEMALRSLIGMPCIQVRLGEGFVVEESSAASRIASCWILATLELGIGKSRCQDPRSIDDAVLFSAFGSLLSEEDSVSARATV